MNIEEIREYCLLMISPLNLKLQGTFAVLDLLEDERGITIKCDSEKGVELR